MKTVTILGIIRLEMWFTFTKEQWYSVNLLPVLQINFSPFVLSFGFLSFFIDIIIGNKLKK